MFARYPDSHQILCSCISSSYVCSPENSHPKFNVLHLWDNVIWYNYGWLRCFLFFMNKLETKYVIFLNDPKKSLRIWEISTFNSTPGDNFSRAATMRFCTMFATFLVRTDQICWFEYLRKFSYYGHVQRLMIAFMSYFMCRLVIFAIAVICDQMGISAMGTRLLLGQTLYKPNSYICLRNSLLLLFKSFGRLTYNSDESAAFFLNYWSINFRLTHERSFEQRSDLVHVPTVRQYMSVSSPHATYIDTLASVSRSTKHTWIHSFYITHWRSLYNNLTLYCERVLYVAAPHVCCEKQAAGTINWNCSILSSHALWHARQINTFFVVIKQVSVQLLTYTPTSSYTHSWKNW